MTTENSDHHNQTNAQSSSLGQKRYALVIDSKGAPSACLIEALADFGLDFHQVDDPQAAVNSLCAEKELEPAVIFLTQQTPWLEGLGLIKYVKRFPQFAKIPQLKFFIEDEEVFINQARTLGAMGARPSQFDSIELKEMLMNLGVLAQPENEKANQASQKQLETLEDDFGGESARPAMAVKGKKACVNPDHAKRLIDKTAFDKVIYASASNDAKSFREHSTVITYLRSLEDTSKQTLFDEEDLYSHRHNADLFGVPTRTGIWSQDDESFSHTPFMGDLNKDSSVIGLGYRSDDSQSYAQYPIQQQMSMGFERMKRQFENDLSEHTGTLQDTLGLMLDVQAETIDRQLHLANRAHRMDRWLRILFFSIALMVSSFWYLTQTLYYKASAYQPADSNLMHTKKTDWSELALNPSAVTPLPNQAKAHQATTPFEMMSVEDQQRLVSHFEGILNQKNPLPMGLPALDDVQADRLSHAVESLSLLGFEGVIEVVSHISPYCVDYTVSGKPVMPTDDAVMCFPWPADAMQAQRQALEQSIVFAQLVDRSNEPGSRLQLLVKAQIQAIDYSTILGEQFDPRQSGQVDSARDWNARAAELNQVTYHILPSHTLPIAGPSF